MVMQVIAESVGERCFILGYISMYLVLYTGIWISNIRSRLNMKYLIDDLEEYAQSDYYPFHMPTQKKKSVVSQPYEIDITEIDGFDNLHHAT